MATRKKPKGSADRRVTHKAADTQGTPSGAQLRAAKQAIILKERREQAYSQLSDCLRSGDKLESALRKAVAYFEADSCVLIGLDDNARPTVLGSQSFVQSALADIGSLVGQCDVGDALLRGEIVTRDVSHVAQLQDNRPKPKFSLWLPVLLYGRSFGALGVFRGKRGKCFQQLFALKWKELGPRFSQFVVNNLGLHGCVCENPNVQKEELRRILRLKAVSIVFQPIVSLWSKRIAGYEALARGPEDSSLHLPVPLFEWASEEGKGDELGLLCVETALASWRRQLHQAQQNSPAVRATFLSLNITPAVAATRELRKKLSAYADLVNPSNLVLEIVELPARSEDLAESVTDIVRCGFSVAADDQGEGWSNTDRLTKLRPRLVKTPCGITKSIGDAAIQDLVKGIVGFASRTGAAVVAEGVESCDELRACHRAGVRFVQGFGFSKGLPVLVTALGLEGEMQAALNGLSD